MKKEQDITINVIIDNEINNRKLAEYFINKYNIEIEKCKKKDSQ